MVKELPATRLAGLSVAANFGQSDELVSPLLLQNTPGTISPELMGRSKRSAPIVLCILLFPAS